MLQLGYFMFIDTTNRPSEFLPFLFERLRDASFASKAPLFQAIFEEISQQDELVRGEEGDVTARSLVDQEKLLLLELTHQVNADPNFVLPPGFTRVRADKIMEEYEPDEDLHPKEANQVALKVLDDILADALDIHILEPVIKHEKYFIVKPQKSAPNPTPLNPGSGKYLNAVIANRANQDLQISQRRASGSTAQPSRSAKTKKLTQRYITAGGTGNRDRDKDHRGGHGPKANNYIAKSSRYQ